MRELTASEARDHTEELRSVGYTIVRDAFAPTLSEEISAELDRLASLRPGGDLPAQAFSGFVTRRWFDLLNDGDVWQKVAVHPGVFAILPRVLGDGFLLSTMGTAVIGPGEKAQPLHVDDAVYGFPRPHPTLVCSTIWAIGDFTAENGATHVVPRSNHFSRGPVEGEHHHTVQLTMPAGSIGLLLGGSYHGAGENRDRSERAGLTINYCRGSLRQHENLMLSIHPARMLTFPEELQDILGFKMCNGAGHLFASEPRDEMKRHYGPGHSDEKWLERRGERSSRRSGEKEP